MELTTDIIRKICQQDIRLVYKLMSKHLNCNFSGINYWDFYPVDRPTLVSQTLIRSKRLHKKSSDSHISWSYGIVNTFHAELENVDNREMEKFLFSIL